jgi:hypothetical protein
MAGPFTPFYSCKEFVSIEAICATCRALQKLTGGRAAEVLPALQNVLLEGFRPSEPVQNDIARFISARQLTNHPVTISVWDRDMALDES